MKYAFAPPQIVTLPAMSCNPFPVRRIFCVGRNYPEHAREMGADPECEPPFFFMKPTDAILPNNSVLPYPPGTENLQPEVELVVAMQLGGRQIPIEIANDYIFGYAVGLDMTLRDVQKTAREKGLPWDMAKGFDHSAPCSAITPEFYTGVIAQGKIELKVNGEVRQSADVSDMIWKIPETISYLSTLVEICPGDLIFTGTPAGTAPVVKGDVIEATVAGLEPLIITIGS
ncbi:MULTISPECIES: fumarylacetoacetate hydrolase family protein [unclassified Methylocaldum]|jgi:fumarylpyruvate hydrolase|uniref:fumarylacetoacetate hydrolase family protein n=1 Tax=unclassified Methylocaldum TaxID=2622260 RepID=UPI00098A9EBC|nr:MULTISPECIES: fumarylacetoacetate hydrolase family protein [unclassified Methylocaldum]MBP1148650.1 fumarylpyruvate hydrolase [Methylocaldum sp. RMAD-M]